MTDHDKAIIEAAERLVDLWAAKQLTDGGFHEAIALRTSVEAKRESERPRLLTAEAAYRAYVNRRGSSLDAMQAVLDADRASVLKIIEALPNSGDCRAEMRFMSEIRSALLPANPMGAKP